MQLLSFSTLSIAFCFKNVESWILPPSLRRKRTQLGPIDRSSPYLRTPDREGVYLKTENPVSKTLLIRNQSER
jgi:hypothetical protein